VRKGITFEKLRIAFLDDTLLYCRAVFLNRQAAARYRAVTSNITGRERSEATTICYKILLVQLITNQVDKRCGRRFNP